MKRRKNWAGRIAMLLAAMLLIGGGAWKYTAGHAGNDSNVLVRQREYTAAVGDITVGINVAGKLSGMPEEVAGIAGLTIAAYYAAPGDRVTAGSKLAVYDRAALDAALAKAFEEDQEARSALDKAKATRKRELNALAARMSKEKKLNADIHEAYTRSLNQLMGRLTSQQRVAADKAHSKPDDETLTSLPAALEQKQEDIRALQEEAAAFRAEQKDHESDILAWTEADLLDMRLLEDQVQAAERLATERRNQLLLLRDLAEDPFLYAGSNGVVTAILTEAGSDIAAGKPLMTLAAEGGWQFSFLVEQGDIASVAENQPVELTANAYPTDSLRGVVTHIKRIAEDDGRYAVTARLDDTRLPLLEGMDGYGTVILARRENVLTLSNKAIYQRNGQQYVTVRNDAGELIERKVLTGFSDGKVSEILSGLEPGDVAVVVETL